MKMAANTLPDLYLCVAEMKKEMTLVDRRSGLLEHKFCFQGRDAVQFFMKKYHLTQQEGIKLGNLLLDQNLIDSTSYVNFGKPHFTNSNAFFCLSDPTKRNKSAVLISQQFLFPSNDQLEEVKQKTRLKMEPLTFDEVKSAFNGFKKNQFNQLTKEELAKQADAIFDYSKKFKAFILQSVGEEVAALRFSEEEKKEFIEIIINSCFQKEVDKHAISEEEWIKIASQNENMQILINPKRCQYILEDWRDSRSREPAPENLWRLPTNQARLTAINLADKSGKYQQATILVPNFMVLFGKEFRPCQKKFVFTKIFQEDASSHYYLFVDCSDGSLVMFKEYLIPPTPQEEVRNELRIVALLNGKNGCIPLSGWFTESHGKAKKPAGPSQNSTSSDNGFIKQRISQLAEHSNKNSQHKLSTSKVTEKEKTSNFKEIMQKFEVDIDDSPQSVRPAVVTSPDLGRHRNKNTPPSERRKEEKKTKTKDKEERKKRKATRSNSVSAQTTQPPSVPLLALNNSNTGILPEKSRSLSPRSESSMASPKSETSTSSLEENEYNLPIFDVPGKVVVLLPYQPPEEIEQDHLKAFFKASLIALKYVHSHNIVHTRINPESIRWNSATKTATIISFRKSYNLNTHSTPPLQDLGSIFCSPEQKSPAWSTPIDVWALGLVVAQIALGGQKILEKQVSNYGFFHSVFSKKRRANFWQDFEKKHLTNILPNNPALTDLLNKMTTFDSADRYTCSDALNHPYFTSD